ncbi:phosphotransferase [Glutamicibacter sp.]|uniref:phosphotransferase n=1 Tax=Glutamicibacter sp. TaxID=1931995 RepID=UPI0028BD6C9F|nr:phosphotransferase [Glutamicibacter sp.]
MTEPRFIACAPTPNTPVPVEVLRAAGEDQVVPVWRNGLGGLTFKLIGASSLRFAKWSPRPEQAEDIAPLAPQEMDLNHEVQRLSWASNYSVVPTVLSFEEFDAGQLMVTEGLMGMSVISEIGQKEPALASLALGAGLRELHTRLPVADCPFEWNVASRTAPLPQDLGARFIEQAPPEDLVVCHGDACAPNTLIDSHFRFVGHVDLGMLGIGDRWADLSIAALSTRWNFGPGFEQYVYDGYEIEPDDQKIDFYRRLWDAT